MKYSIITCLFILSTFISKAQLFSSECSGGRNIVPIEDINLCNDSEWVLVFEDNFDGDSLDRGAWKDSGGPGSLKGAARQDFQTLDNAIIKNGVLSLISKKERVQGKVVRWKAADEIMDDGLPNLRWHDYTSAQVMYQKKVTYGYYEASCKVPDGKGIWPAMWQYGDYIDRDNNKFEQELDVFEFWDDKPRKIRTNVHHDGDACSANFRGPDYSKSFHTYGLLWEPFVLEWYVDGEMIRRYSRYSQNGADAGCRLDAWQLYQERPFPKDSMTLYLNIAVDNRSGQKPDNSTIFPKEFEIDWVRCFSRLDILSKKKESYFFTELYPNPNQGAFTINLRSGAVDQVVVNVFSVGYAHLLTKNLTNGENDIALCNFGKGIYFVEVENRASYQKHIHKVCVCE